MDISGIKLQSSLQRNSITTSSSEKEPGCTKWKRTNPLSAITTSATHHSLLTKTSLIWLEVKWVRRSWTPPNGPRKSNIAVMLIYKNHSILSILKSSLLTCFRIIIWISSKNLDSPLSNSLDFSTSILPKKKYFFWTDDAAVAKNFQKKERKIFYYLQKRILWLFLLSINFSTTIFLKISFGHSSQQSFKMDWLFQSIWRRRNNNLGKDFYFFRNSEDVCLWCQKIFLEKKNSL